ncbi:hypothetical protein Sfulv_20500 [Streptomyces fulvorobeus]|uniref:Uncharacterized protein n=1 Tax=Streptomyces fulvorobeus TaxID=284028 RepID=A0A7J0C3Z7_9ACTN|nr:hypothetical protein [Streptomyces fulvorobeus]NYE40920.1 hypothetical protein [Streptomyces fulvorobeus]GFM97239.1 hypothetical protein Sfulv_20500 [Streptomyces fulvorobeus]
MEAVDALLITRGFPEIVQSWRVGVGRVDFLRVAVANPLPPLVVAVSRSGFSDGLPLAAAWRRRTLSVPGGE